MRRSILVRFNIEEGATTYQVGGQWKGYWTKAHGEPVDGVIEKIEDLGPSTDAEKILAFKAAIQAFRQHVGDVDFMGGCSQPLEHLSTQLVLKGLLPVSEL